MAVTESRQRASSDQLSASNAKSLKPEYPMLGLLRDAFPYRIPGPRFGRYASLVMVAPCNMACPYCDVGGYAKDDDHNLPGWSPISLREIEAFVDEEVDRGRIIYLTGGEPLMFPELVAHIGAKVRRRGGYTSVATNASARQRLRMVSPHVDEFSVSLKGTPQTAASTSGVTGRLAFDLPHQNTLGLLNTPGITLELVVVLFDALTYENFCEIYRPFFGRAYLTLKQYRPKITTVHKEHSYTTVLLEDRAHAEVQPMSLDRAHDLFRRLVKSYPEHGAYFGLVTGGGGDQHVFRGDEEHFFQR
ncbi:radical SAM protein [Bradyrhizobium prioriisuperbiae]|uniref:radical SAM protein n=1 Tax=Bradyrhizobium prioriisuperbiae TaxID=2854389 RepID=UPI0028E3CA4E|nr:radical SAM protein [Bradyrhizobium prioritasuperba]